MPRANAGSTTVPNRFRIVKTRLGHAWYMIGDRGLVRSGLPEASVAEARRRAVEFDPQATEDRTLAPEVGEALAAYFASGVLACKIAIDERGMTEFQRQVYKELRRVPRGRTVTYAELARRVGRPKAARGVGVAMRLNPVPPFVPCHRVLTSTGGLGGFSSSGGVEQKRKMLQLESQTD